MTREEAKNRIEILKREIGKYRRAYHVLDISEISDEALDSLKKELFDIETKYPEFITPDSPTQRVGGEPLKEFKKAPHEFPMLSFNDAFSEEDMLAWLERVENYLKKKIKPNFYCELKLDGLSVELTYKNKVLIRAATRGDGKIGEDVTQNAKTISAIPLQIDDSHSKVKIPEVLTVRGEIFMPRDEFSRINREQEEKGLKAYANPRNIAAGSVRQLDSKITASRKLDSFQYDIVGDIGIGEHHKEHEILESWGFNVNPHNKLVNSLDEVFVFRDKWGSPKNRERLDYEIDGVVVLVDNNDIFDEAGVVGKAPRAGIAYKFSPKEATTIVREIKWQVGRTGVLTPVAVMNPVNVGGVTITHATLHNMDQIDRLGLMEGDTVVVSRAGDVIPQITKVLIEFRTGEEKRAKIPAKCPVDGSLVIGDGVAVKCSNPECGARVLRSIRHFVSRGAFDIEGLGPKIIDRFIEEGLIDGVADIFSLEKGDIVALPRLGEKSAENLISEIEEKKKIPLQKLIYSLGIINVGEETAITLAKEAGFESKNGYVSADEFIRVMTGKSIEDLERMPDVGPKVAETIKRWFSSKKNIDMVRRLGEAGVKIIFEKAENAGGKLDGQTVVITGSLETMSRDEAKEAVRKAGGQPSESVSKKTSFVVAGSEAGSKKEKAEKLGVKVIDEKEFLKMLE